MKILVVGAGSAMLAAMLSAMLAAQAPVPPRDVPAARDATATVKGRVTAAATRSPLHRVKITLQGGSSPTPLSSVTDPGGAYEIPNVPAGTYTVLAERAGYLSTTYGQRRPRESGRRVPVKAGETVEGIDFALQRGGVLAGAIRDDLGDPFPGIRVEALEFRYLRGRRVLLPAALGRTDDLGEYRISGLQPGTYFLRASSADTWLDDDGKTTNAYAVTLYPGVAGAEQAQSVTLEPAQEISALDFSLRRGRTAQITGRIENAAGEPLPAQAISLSRIIRGVGGALFASGPSGVAPVRSDATGAFTFPPIAPGEYTVNSGGQADLLMVSVMLGDADVRHVILSPRKPTAVTGTIVTDEGKPPPFNAALLRVDPIASDADSLLPLWEAPRAATVAREGAFRLSGLNGQYVLRVTGLPDEWRLAAVLRGERDIIDTPFTVRAGEPEISGLRVVVSKGGAIDGQVVNADGTRAEDATVLAFATEPARWTVASRFVRASRLDLAGRFVFAGLPPGSYFVIARDFIEDGRWEDPDFLATLTRQATRITAEDGQPQSLTLKLLPPP